MEKQRLALETLRQQQESFQALENKKDELSAREGELAKREAAVGEREARQKKMEIALAQQEKKLRDLEAKLTQWSERLEELRKHLAREVSAEVPKQALREFAGYLETTFVRFNRDQTGSSYSFAVPVRVDEGGLSVSFDVRDPSKYVQEIVLQFVWANDGLEIVWAESQIRYVGKIENGVLIPKEQVITTPLQPFGDGACFYVRKFYEDYSGSVGRQ